jgi:cation diffusion facilitator CzcD-associated flavoprotein CzcO
MHHHAVVIGAGPAGLATSRELGRHGIDHVVLERGNRLGHTWANLYDSLVLHTGKHLSALPGLPFSRTTRLFPSRRDFLHYLEEYARQFDLPVRTGAEVGALTRADGQWRLQTRAGSELTAGVVVIATGIVSNPYTASIPGREQFAGRVIHSVEYHRPDAHVGRRVLVIGAGNSAGEIAAELAAAGAHVTIAVRSGARVVPRDLFGGSSSAAEGEVLGCSVDWVPSRRRDPRRIDSAEVRGRRVHGRRCAVRRLHGGSVR